jgi:glycosyltransferase involved in cell wall biosynthesis
MTGGRLRVHTLIDSLTWGGAEMLLGDLAAGAPYAGIELSVGYLKESDESPAAGRLRAAGIEPTFVGSGRLLDMDSLRRVRAHLRACDPDLLHTHLPTADVLGAIAARSLGIPTVSTIHLIDRAVTDPRGPRTAIKGRLTSTVRRYGDARIIAVSEAARRAYLERNRERQDRVVTIHNGIAAPRPRRSREEVRAELGIAADAFVVAIVTVLREGKGHDLAVQAVAQLRPRHPGLTLLIVGDGPDRQRICELAAPLGKSAVLAGHRDIPDTLQSVDVLLHPTRMDAFPTILLEACAAGLPTLATAVGGIPEIVSDGRNGMLLAAPPTVAAIAVALDQLIADPGLRARLGDEARATYEREFTAERWARRLRSLYDEILASRGRRVSEPVLE